MAIRLIFGSVLIAAFAAIPASAQVPPSPPHVFYGSATVNGQLAPVGAQVEARGAGVKTGIDSNPVAVTVAGRYGGPTGAERQLGVQGSIDDGTPIEFYIDGMKAECAVPGGQWKSNYPFQSGTVTELNLRVGGADQPTNTPTATATTASATATATTAPAAGSTSTPRATREDVVATATRQTPQAAASPQTPAPGTPVSSPAAGATRATSAPVPGNVVVATPTNLAAPGGAAPPTATPTLQPTATPSATPAPAMPTEPPTLAPTAAAIAKMPQATSKPIIELGTPSPAGQPTAQPGPNSGSADAASGRAIALWGGLAALAIAVAAGVIIWVRSRSG